MVARILTILPPQAHQSRVSSYDELYLFDWNIVSIPPMRFSHGSAILLSLSAGLAIFSPQSASAALCTPGVDSGTFTYAQWEAAVAGGDNITCTVGDKTYSNFQFTSGDWSSSSFSISNVPTAGMEQHSFAAAGGYGVAGGTLSYSYDVTIIPATSPMRLYAFATQIGSSSPLGINAGSKDLMAYVTGGTPICPLVSASFSSDGAGSASSPTCMHDLTGMTLNYSGNVMVTQGLVNTFSDTIVQTPGPLPIIGAGAALGFSRKLRGRVKASA
jgi:hypothetical protein